MQGRSKLIPIYTSHGDAGAFLVFPYLYNPEGEWIGWVEADRTVFSVHGHYVGVLTKEPRILRKREWGNALARRIPPPAPPPIRPPAQVPLAPPLAEVPLNMIDVLAEAPDLLPPMDWGELREDMD
jgi:hypothetical protein